MRRQKPKIQFLGLRELPLKTLKKVEENFLIGIAGAVEDGNTMGVQAGKFMLRYIRNEFKRRKNKKHG